MISSHHKYESWVQYVLLYIFILQVLGLWLFSIKINVNVFCTHTVHKWWTLWCHSLVNEASSCLGKLEVVREGRREANDASCNEHTLSELPVSLSLSWIPQPINLWNHSDLIRSLSKGAAFNKHKSFCSPIRMFDALVCWLQFRNKNYVHHFTPTTFFFLVNVLTSCEPLLARL